MTIYCLHEFKTVFDNLSKKKPYKSLEQELIDYFFNKEISQILSGTRLNNSVDTPYIKKRLEGSGGYRVYYLIVRNKDSIYLMFVHPKTGPEGSENITDESKAYIYKEVLDSIKNNRLLKLVLSANQNKIEFMPFE